MSETPDPRRLDLLIPETGFPDSDDAMEVFISWAERDGLSLYPHQEEALLEIFSGGHVILNTPTGSGKSLVATAMIFKAFSEAKVAYMTAPIKALVTEKFFSLCHIFGAENVGMMTGDGAVNRDAPILICTAEILANLSLREGEDARVHAVIMDEFHYYGDRDRGMAWQVPLLTLPQTTFLLMSATLGDTSEISDRLEQRTGTPVALITGVERPIPLTFTWSEDPIHDTIQSLIRHDKAPVYIVHFSQREATELAGAMLSTDLCTKTEKEVLKDVLKGVRFNSIFGKTMRRLLHHGVGLHHAGLLPKYRIAVESMAQKGLLKVICGTDTLGVGINVPIRTVLFTKLTKYDGKKSRVLTVRDFHQIAGRAGRAGFDTEGLVIAMAPEHAIENKRIKQKAEAAGKKKVKLKSAPTKNFVPWDETIFEQLIARDPEELKSRFRLDHGTLLALLQNAEARTGDAADGLTTLRTLLDLAHLAKKDRTRLIDRSQDLLDELLSASVIAWIPDFDDPDRTLVLAPDLQSDFSLHHSLSLFLVETLATLDKTDPNHALDTITLTEAVLENPSTIMRALENKAKSDAITKMKAEGIPYEERIEALETITWDKPREDWLNNLYNLYAPTHPWVVGRELNPKSIVRAMYSDFRTFNGWVKEYRLERSEGVLLRYLSEAYKALVQNIPTDDRTEGIWDAIAWLRAMLRSADSSLIEEWERLAYGTEPDENQEEILPDISANPSAFRARIRTEVHTFLRAIATAEYDEAITKLRTPPTDDCTAWTSSTLLDTLTPYLDRYGEIRADHGARLSQFTTINADGAYRWRVVQTLVDYPPPQAHEMADLEEPDNVSFLHFVVNLCDDKSPDGPILSLSHVEVLD